MHVRGLTGPVALLTRSSIPSLGPCHVRNCRAFSQASRSRAEPARISRPCSHHARSRAGQRRLRCLRRRGSRSETHRAWRPRAPISRALGGAVRGPGGAAGHPCRAACAGGRAPPTSAPHWRGSRQGHRRRRRPPHGALQGGRPARRRRASVSACPAWPAPTASATPAWPPRAPSPPTAHTPTPPAPTSAWCTTAACPTITVCGACWCAKASASRPTTTPRSPPPTCPGGCARAHAWRAP